MNKIFLVLLLLFPAAAMAAPLEMYLQLTGHSGESRTTIMQWSAQQITLNGINISSDIVPSISKPLSILFKPKNDRGEDCASGTYKHQVLYKAKWRVAKGCLNSKTAQNLIESVKKIESLSFLRRLPSAQ